MWCTTVISPSNSGQQTNQGLFIIRWSSWNTTYCGHTQWQDCTDWISLNDLLPSVATQLAHSTGNHKSDSVVRSQQNKAQQRKHAIYYLFLAKQKPLTWWPLAADSVGSLSDSELQLLQEHKSQSSFSVLKALTAGCSQRYVDSMEGMDLGGFVSFWR